MNITKFIIISLITFILYTVLAFLWHNNLFPAVYYASQSVHPLDTQNTLLIILSIACLICGMVYFMFMCTKPGTKMINVMLWCIYYNLSVIGFFDFLNAGIQKEWYFNMMLLDLFWAVIAGGLSGIVLYWLMKWIKFVNISE